MRKLATYVTIDKLSPIEGADRLEVAKMKGKEWQVVVAKNEFLPGDSAVYFEIDSYLPVGERYAFLKDRCLRKFVSKSGSVLKEGIRIKTVKLRGVVSQGLLMPEASFPELDDLLEAPCEGADLTELLKVEHYDEVADALRPLTGASLAGDAMGPFPSFIPKTDEERIQNLKDYFTTMKNRVFQVTEKADGSSVTMFYSPTVDPENPFGVCSRNLRLKPKTEAGVVPLAWQMADRYFVEAALKKLYEEHGIELAVQGELVGPGINGNRDLRTEHEWLVFRMFDIKKQKFVAPDEAHSLATRKFKFPHVRVLAEDAPVFANWPDFDSLMEYAQGKTLRGHEREGIVCKTVDHPYVSFKVVSNKYLLKSEG